MQADQIGATPGVDPIVLDSIERVYRDWDAALHAKHVEAAVALYEEVQLESPLVRYLTKSRRGVVRGRDNLARVHPHCVRADTGEPWSTIAAASSRWPQAGLGISAGDAGWHQMDVVEPMDIEDGLIKRHCVYWGWFGVQVIEQDRYRRRTGTAATARLAHLPATRMEHR